MSTVSLVARLKEMLIEREVRVGRAFQEIQRVISASEQCFSRVETRFEISRAVGPLDKELAIQAQAAEYRMQ